MGIVMFGPYKFMILKFDNNGTLHGLFNAELNKSSIALFQKLTRESIIIY